MYRSILNILNILFIMIINNKDGQDNQDEQDQLIIRKKPSRKIFVSCKKFTQNQRFTGEVTDVKMAIEWNVDLAAGRAALPSQYRHLSRVCPKASPVECVACS